jgi:hypothetical protein
MIPHENFSHKKLVLHQLWKKPSLFGKNQAFFAETKLFAKNKHF